MTNEWRPACFREDEKYGCRGEFRFIDDKFIDFGEDENGEPCVAHVATPVLLDCCKGCQFRTKP